MQQLPDGTVVLQGLSCLKRINQMCFMSHWLHKDWLMTSHCYEERKVKDELKHRKATTCDRGKGSSQPSQSQFQGQVASFEKMRKMPADLQRLARHICFTSASIKEQQVELSTAPFPDRYSELRPATTPTLPTHPVAPSV